VALTSVLCAAAFLFLWLDRHERDLVPWLVGGAAWGLAGPAVLTAAGVRFPQLLGAPGTGAPVPELWLAAPALAAALPLLGVALPLALIARSRVLDGPSSGAVFGLTVGLAFSVGMHVLLLIRTAWQPAAGALAFVSLLHATVGAALGAGIGWGDLAAPPALRIPSFLGATAAAAALGAVLVFGARAGWRRWGEANDACNLALAVVSLVVLMGVIGLTLAFERRVLGAQLAEEVELGVLPPWVTAVVPSYPRRIRSEWWGRRDERREITRLLVGLAFRKYKLRRLPEDRARLYGLEVGRLRQRARVLLAPPPVLPPATSGAE